MAGEEEYWATQEEQEAKRVALRTPRTYPDGTLNHREEALRNLELAEWAGVHSPEGFVGYNVAAQVHATLHAAEVEVESMKLMRHARIQAREGDIFEHARHVLRL
jgi:hypothetical protein